MVTMAEPLLITVYDKGFHRVGWIGNPEKVELHPRHNLQPDGTIQVANDHRLAARLLEPGCRVTVDYHGQQVLSGPVNLASGAIFADGSITVQIRDDWSLLTDLLGWPVPGAAVTAQTTAAYDVRSGPAETVLKGYVAAAAARTGIPLTVATDLGRGSNIDAAIRWTSLADQLLPKIDAAGIGVSVRQVGTGLVLDCYEPAWFPQELTPESGIIEAATWSLAAPTLTRAVAGGQGDLTARATRQYVSTATETLYGPAFVREGFIDATDVSATTEPALSNQLIARAQQLVLEAAAKSGLALTLAETGTFRYGETLRVGDLVTAALVPGGAPITDVLREATITWTPDDGLEVVPIVGERTDDPSRTLAKAIRSTAARLNQIVTRR